MAQYDGFKKLLKSRTQWERIRHPWAGVVRVVLVLTLPIVLWSHNPLEFIVWMLVAFLHPGFFPAYVVAGKEAPILTRMADAVQQWHDVTAPNERTMDILPSAVLALPLFCALWLNILFWAAYFYLAMIACKGVFLRRQLHAMEEREHQKVNQMVHVDHIGEEEHA